MLTYLQAFEQTRERSLAGAIIPVNDIEPFKGRQCGIPKIVIEDAEVLNAVQFEQYVLLL